MNLNANFHTHTKYCDGKDIPEQYIISAIEKGLSALGFSGHAPVPFESWWNMTDENFKIYLDEIKNLKQKYSSEIEIYSGAEVDFIKGVQSLNNFKKIKLDYIIGSIHFLYPENAEQPWDFIISPSAFKEGLEKYFNNNIYSLIDYYFEQMNLMAEEKPDIIAHFDQVNKFNRGDVYFSENHSRYLKKAYESLELIAEKNIIIEINTRGKLKGLTENFYPSDKLLKYCKEKKIPIILSADAHKPSEVDSNLKEAFQTAKQIGFEELCIFAGKSFIKTEFQDLAL